MAGEQSPTFDSLDLGATPEPASPNRTSPIGFLGDSPAQLQTGVTTGDDKSQTIDCFEAEALVGAGMAPEDPPNGAPEGHTTGNKTQNSALFAYSPD